MLQNNNFKLTQAQILLVTSRFAEREVIYQVADELLTVAEDADTLSFIKNVVSDSPAVRVVSRNSALDEGYEDLAGWSNEHDILLLVDYDALVCLPKDDYSDIIYGKKQEL